MDERELMRRLARFLGLGVKEGADRIELFQAGSLGDGSVPCPGWLWAVDRERPVAGGSLRRAPGLLDRLEESRGLPGFGMRPESGWPPWLKKGVPLEELDLRLAAMGF